MFAPHSPPDKILTAQRRLFGRLFHPAKLELLITGLPLKKWWPGVLMTFSFSPIRHFDTVQIIEKYI